MRPQAHLRQRQSSFISELCGLMVPMVLMVMDMVMIILMLMAGTGTMVASSAMAMVVFTEVSGLAGAANPPTGLSPGPLRRLAACPRVPRAQPADIQLLPHGMHPSPFSSDHLILDSDIRPHSANLPTLFHSLFAFSIDTYILIISGTSGPTGHTRYYFVQFFITFKLSRLPTLASFFTHSLHE